MKPLISTQIVIAALAVLPAVGCATTDAGQVTSQEYAKPRETIRAAQEVGATEVPRARMHLKYAQNAVDRATAYLEGDQDYQARLALRRAQADADLALTMAKERQMVQQVQQVDRRIKQLNSQAPQ